MPPPPNLQNSVAMEKKGLWPKLRCTSLAPSLVPPFLYHLPTPLAACMTIRYASCFYFDTAKTLIANFNKEGHRSTTRMGFGKQLIPMHSF